MDCLEARLPGNNSIIFGEVGIDKLEMQMEFIIILPDPTSWSGAMVDKGAPVGGQHDDSQTWRSDRDGKSVVAVQSDRSRYLPLTIKVTGMAAIQLPKPAIAYIIKSFDLQLIKSNVTLRRGLSIITT